MRRGTVRKATRAMAPLVALALVAAACGGDDDGGDATEPTAEAPTAEEPEPTAEEPTAEEPTAEEPTAEEPTAEEPTAEEPTAEEPTAVDPSEILTDFGVNDERILIGLNADLSGIFAPLVTQIVDGQEAYWEIVNDQGGIGGRQVELRVMDNAYDVPTHLENYEAMADESDEGVIM